MNRAESGLRQEGGFAFAEDIDFEGGEGDDAVFIEGFDDGACELDGGTATEFEGLGDGVPGGFFGGGVEGPADVLSAGFDNGFFLLGAIAEDVAGEFLFAGGGRGGLIRAEGNAREEGVLGLIGDAGAGEVEEGEAGFGGVRGALAGSAEQDAGEEKGEAERGGFHRT